MKYCQAGGGRVFILRLEEGEILHETIERFAAEQGIRAASVLALGGAGKGSRLVVGPRDGAARPVEPMERSLEDVHEIAGVGTIFPDPGGQPSLHMHAACGRSDETVTGCVRRGVRVWQIAEVVITELVGATGRRELDAALGFELLNPAPAVSSRGGE
jgi:predicted DNA-binding protein with PD1-like motif